MILYRIEEEKVVKIQYSEKMNDINTNMNSSLCDIIHELAHRTLVVPAGGVRGGGGHVVPQPAPAALPAALHQRAAGAAAAHAQPAHAHHHQE